MTKRSKESEETFKLIAPGSLWQGVNSSGDRVVGYRLPSTGNGVWLKGGDGWRWRDRPWRYGWPWGAGDMPVGERDFVVIGVYPSLEALSNDQIKALCECASDVAAVKVGDSITWDQVPSYALVHVEGDRYAVRIAKTDGSDGWSCVVNGECTDSGTWKYFTGAHDITKPVTVVALDLKRGFNANQVPPLVAAYKALPPQVVVRTKQQAAKVGDTIDWYTTPDNAMVRDSDGGIALRRGRHGQWRCVVKWGERVWGEYISFVWDDSKDTMCRRTDNVVVVALDVPLDCTSDKQLETCALNATMLREPAPAAKKDIVVGDRIAWDDTPHWALVHIEDDQYAIRFDERGRSAHADGTYWRPKHKDIQKWQGLHATCTVVALTEEYGTTSGEADRLVAAHVAQRAAPKVGDVVAWDKVPDNAMVKADGGCIALRRGVRGRWYKNKFPNGWSTDSYIAFNWTNKDDAARTDNDAVIVALDVPPGTEDSTEKLRVVAGDA